jgi:hypothetical protein
MSQVVSDPMVDYEATAPRSKYRLRFSLLALFLFVTLICLALAWLVMPNQVVATALFEVQGSERKLMGNRPYDEREFAIIKRSQLAKLSSYYVLQAAVRNPVVAALPVFQNQPDPAVWLQENVEVDFPEDGEIMAIRLRGPESRSNDLVLIVDSVAKAYEDEVIFADAQTRLATRDLKAQLLRKLKEELLDKMQTLYDIKKEIGTRAAESVDVHARQMEVEVLTNLTREVSRSLELDDIEANAPSRIKQVQNAVISPDN